MVDDTHRQLSLVIRLLAAAGICISIAACSSLEQLTTGSIVTKAPETTTTATLPLATLAVKPIIGPSGAIGEQMMRQLNESAVRQNIALLVDADAKAPYTLQGYLTLVRDKKGAKITYIWDVTDAAGQRLSRITGEEAVVGEAPPAGSDKWIGVTAMETQQIADKAIVSANTTIKR